MGVPGTAGQLVILLLFVLPGSVFQAVGVRLRGPIPADQDATTKILRALAVSTGLNAAYLAVLGQPLLKAAAAKSVAQLEGSVGVRQLGLWALICLFVVPTVLAGASYWSSRIPWSDVTLKAGEEGLLGKWFGWARLAYHPAPRTWDYAFTNIGPGYIRIEAADGAWHGGRFEDRSSAASFPEPLEVFIDKPYRMSKTGEFLAPLKGSSGVYVRCDDARAVEFFADSSRDVPAPLASHSVEDREGDDEQQS